MKRAVKLLGWLVSLACIGILAGQIKDHLPAFLALVDRRGFAASFGGATFLHLVALVGLALGWGHCVAYFSGVRQVSLGYVAAFGRTNIFKYLPGNAMQFVARQVICARLSAKNADMVRTSISDLAMTASAAAVLGGILAMAAPAIHVNGFGGVSLSLLVGLGMLAVAVAWGIVWVIPRAGITRLTFVTPFAAFIATPDFVRAAVLYLAFFAINILVLKVIAIVIPEAAAATLPLLGFAYAASWLMGTVTPGAPAGFGVREAVLILILGPVIGDMAATVIATVLRFVNLTGELLLFALAAILPLPPAPRSPNGVT